MNIEDYNKYLNKDLIAQSPLEERTESKLMILDKNRRNRT